MSTEVLEVLRQSMVDQSESDGALELTTLGKRLEILRIERGVSKQYLARHAGTSRQQLWRVMTGKSELTGALRERLALALSVEPRALYRDAAPSGHPAAAAPAASPPDLGEFLADASYLSATLETLPSGDGGRRLGRALLNAVEDLAAEAGAPLSVGFSEIRRRVMSDDR